MKSFQDRQIELTIQLGTGTFGESLGDTVTLSGLRIFADMVSPCGESMGALQMRVYGLTQTMMNQLTVLPPFGQVSGATKIILNAGNAGDALTQIFKGSIWQAWADYSGAPEVAFNIVAYVGMDIKLKPVQDSSFTGGTSVSSIMSGLAGKAGLEFIDSGVNVTLYNPIYSGSALDQIQSCAREANIYYKIENDVLTIWPKDGYITSPEPTISPASGMVGYPALSSQGLNVKTLFNPGVTMGGIVNIESSLQMATGKFQVLNLTHSISSLAPGGPWFSELLCFPLKK